MRTLYLIIMKIARLETFVLGDGPEIDPADANRFGNAEVVMLLRAKVGIKQ